MFVPSKRSRNKFTNKHLKIGHLNVRSLQPHIEALSDAIRVHELDIIGITETWLTRDHDDQQLLLNNFSFLRKDYRGRGSGVGIYIHRSLDFVQIQTVSTIEHLTVKVSINSKNFLICVAYRNHDINYNTFIAELESIISQCLIKHEFVILVGDFNINILNSGDIMARAYLQAMQDVGFTQIITEPTRGRSLLDHILVSDTAFVTQSGVEPCEVSDHDLTYVVLDSIKTEKVPKYLQIRDFSNFEIETFRDSLQNSELQSMYRVADIDQKVRIFSNTILHLYDTFAPFRNIRVTKPNSPWLTDNVRLIMSLRDRAKARYKTSGRESHWTAYKQLRNLATLSVRAEKKAYLHYKLSNGNSKSLYKALKQMNINNKVTKSIPLSIANVDEINKYFTQHTNSSTNNTQMLHFYNTHKHINFKTEFAFKTVDRSTVSKIINNINTAATGSDGLNINLIKQCGPQIIDYITHIVNSCILENHFPSAWKEAIALPFPKADAITETKQLRLISILPAASKVLERILAGQLQEYIDHYGILPSIQSGFRPAHSCTTALLCITDDILRATDKGQITLLAALDFSRAFDTVDHQMLIAVLNYIGVGSGARKLFASYLLDRSQRVKLYGTLSGSRPVRAGVPQGSILSPLLFAIYTHRVPSVLKYSKIHMYADDVQIYLSCDPQNIQEATYKINQDLEAISDIAGLHSLQLNPKKSNIILLGSQTQCDRVANLINVSLNNENIPIVNEIKILGLLMDNTFRYRQHVSKCLQRAYGSLRLLYPHRTYLPHKVKISLCSTLVLSQLNYCSEVISPALDYNTQYRIQKLQNACLRFIFGIRKYQHVSYKLTEINWLNTKNRFKIRELALYHSILTTMKPSYLYQKITFRTDVHNVNIRRKDKITAPKHRTTLFERSFTYRIFSIYSPISEDVKSLPKVKFKKYLKTILFRGNSI